MTEALVRGTGPGDILDYVRRLGPTTRRDIQLATGLSRVTVGQRVESLLASGFLRERGRADSTGGRRPLQLEFDPEAGVVLTAALNTERAWVGVVDLGLAVLVTREISVEISPDPAHTLDVLLTSMRSVLAETGRDASSAIGIGLSVPGPVDPASGRLNEPPIMSGWHDFDIAGHFQRSLDLPVLVENDANAMALGEYVAEYPDEDALVFLKVSTGIGAGIVLDGRVWAGHDGGAGDIGHMRVSADPGGRVCRCGSVGCLAADASGGSLATQLRQGGFADVATARDVADLVRTGTPEAIALVRHAGAQIGEVMASLVSVVNPEVVIVGGDLAGPELLSAMVSSMLPRCMPRATRHLQVRLSTLGETATLIGVAHQVISHVYAPERVNQRLSR